MLVSGRRVYSYQGTPRRGYASVLSILISYYIMHYIYYCIPTNIDTFHFMLRLAYDIVIIISIVISIIRNKKLVAESKHAISQLEI